jgi:quercetin dioxygenase-like cupin family protein
MIAAVSQAQHTVKGNVMSHTYIVLASNIPAVIFADLDEIANQLRAQISAGGVALAKQPLPLATQHSIQEVLLVVRGAEEQHTHTSDLVFYVLEGGGQVQLVDGEVVDAPAGATIVVPAGVSHAYINKSSSDSVLIATLSPAAPQAGGTRASKRKRPSKKTPAPAS